MDMQTLFMAIGLLGLIGAYIGWTMGKMKGVIPGLVVGIIVGALILPSALGVDLSFDGYGSQPIQKNQSANITFKTELSDYNSSISSYDRSTRTLTVPITITGSGSSPVSDVTEVTATFTVDRTDLNTDSNIQGVTTVTHAVPEIKNEDTTALTTAIYPVSWRSGFTRESFDIEYDSGIYDKTRVVVTTTPVEVDVVIAVNADALDYLDAYENAPMTFNVAGDTYTINFLVISKSA